MDYIINHTDPANGSFVIKPYTANGPATPSAAALYPSAVSANTSLILRGKGAFDYGESFQEDFVHILENFAGPTAPFYPIQGQLWYNNITSVLSVYNGSTWNDEIVINGLLLTNLDVNNNKIINLANATSGTDAVNLQTGDGRYLKLSGGTVTGLVTLSGGATGLPPPILATDAATKAYVDTVAVPGGVFVDVNGDTMTGPLIMSGTNLNVVTGNINISTGNLQLTSSGITAVGVSLFDFGGNELKNLLSPTISTSAATKGYVDLAISSIPPPASDGVVFAGLMSGTTLTLSRTVGPNVVITGISPSPHTHLPAEIIFDGNPSGYDNSRIRQLSINQPLFPAVSLLDVVTYFDQDLHATMNRKRRTLFSLGFNIIAFNIGADTWTISGNYTSLFPPASVFRISEDSNAATNKTYTTLSSVFSSPNTVITITPPGDIPVGTVGNGTIIHGIVGVNPGANTWTVSGNYASEFTTGNTFRVEGNSDAPSNKKYTVVSYTYISPNTIVVVTAGTIPGTANATTGGTVLLTHALDLDSEYTVEYNRLAVHGNGIKLYANERGSTHIILSGILGGDWCGLLNGSYSFNISVDGIGPTLVPFTVAQPSYSIIGVTPGGNTWTISGNVANQFIQYETIVVWNNTGLGLSINTIYTIMSAIDSGPNTIITVSQTIGVGATNDGTMEKALLIMQLETLVNTALSTAGAAATFDADTSLLQFFSNSTGISSQTTFADVDFISTIGTNLAISPQIFNRSAVATNLGYREVGDPFTLSNLIELDSSVVTGTVVECICS